MAKQGMARPEHTHTQPKNEMPPVPEIQGKARPIISGTSAPSQKVFHTNPHKREKEIEPEIYPVIDTDLARDNAENDLTAADLQDL